MTILDHPSIAELSSHKDRHPAMQLFDLLLGPITRHFGKTTRPSPQESRLPGICHGEIQL
jgi:hypothetical protein